MHFGSQVAVRVQLTLVLLVAAKTDIHALILKHGKWWNAAMSHLRVTSFLRRTGKLLRPAVKRKSENIIRQQQMTGKKRS